MGTFRYCPQIGQNFRKSQPQSDFHALTFQFRKLKCSVILRLHMSWYSITIGAKISWYQMQFLHMSRHYSKWIYIWYLIAARVSHNAMFSKKGQLWIMPCHSHIKFNNDCESDKKSLLVFFISREAAQTIVKAMKLMATRSQDCEIARNLWQQRSFIWRQRSSK